MIRRVWFIAFLFIASAVSGQDFMEYTMADTTVTDCDGFLSDTGGPDMSYSINEDLMFTVNTGGVSIEVDFLADVCIEDGFDTLYVYDGVDDNGILLAAISGFDFTPPQLVATSGAVTFHFVSDQSASYCGFEVFWNTIVGPPTPPTASVDAPACGTNEFIVDFSYPIGCEWLLEDSVTFVGNGPIDILNAEVICTDDEGTQASFITASPLDYNCEYFVEMVLAIPDVCDSIWHFDVTASFLLSTCDLQSYIIADEEELCGGGCTNIEAGVSGCFEHSYVWDNGLPDGPGPHQVCPEVTTTYTVTITELATGNVGTESITINVVTPTIDPPSGPMCQSEPAFFLQSNTPGGQWFGPGVQDEDSGWFVPDSLNPGINVIYYVATETCFDSVIYDVTAIEAGLFDAACPGTAPFFLDPETPGGTWQGDSVTVDGWFNPEVAGTYPLVYSLDGCTDTLIATVAEITGTFDLGDMCQSLFPDTLDFSPLGGEWSGPGILDPLYGIFSPNDAPPGPHTLLYQVEGCDQEFTVNVLEIYTGERVRSSCPEQAPFIPQPDFAPAGGSWSGDGITDANTGMYDPGSVPNDYWANLIYTAPNGCQDTIFYYNRQTEIPVDTAWFCITDDPLNMNENNTGRTPFGGIWTGAGISNPWGDRFDFTPASAGVGAHWLTYEANGCSDSLLVYVIPTELNAPSHQVCTNADPFYLDPNQPEGGSWVGLGVVEPSTGLYDPSQSFEGSYWIYWTTPTGCGDSVFVEVEEFFQATLTGLEEVYCWSNEDIPLELFPDDGTLTGSTGPDTFNPALAGEGNHVITYEWSGNFCASNASAEVFVYPQLLASLQASDTVICPGAGTQLSVVAEGGIPDVLYEVEWSDGLFPVTEVTGIPEESQYFYVQVDDGCSDTFIDSVWIEVLPRIEPVVTTSDTLCFGYDGGFASAEMDIPEEFTITWSGNGDIDGNDIYTTAGTVVDLNIIDIDNGCEFDSLVLVPSYTPIAALFTPNPNEDCIPWTSQPVTFIDFSQHGLTGLWDFGNDNIELYNPGTNPTQSYDTPGDYTVSLYIENEGACPDSITRNVCILPPTPIFVADIFSPNGDMINDELFVRGSGIIEMNFTVYDRWGELVWSTDNMEAGWDGNFRGQEMPAGVYVWFLRARLNDGLTEELTGNVTLIR
ncbi:gliding motility-associated C-terminal domain-containing protein [Sanyastnella coralliicola]|uniref:T9SS type B sorting domain-containing protein n=1 Tax=Sanyastnella coralliicola TaxID=3069118 RepID=UPI0027BA9A89|nr:gliding motility-associated C-terminal domain-containing protein [Longitalea sp. SCSIO 12813]